MAMGNSKGIVKRLHIWTIRNQTSNTVTLNFLSKGYLLKMKDLKSLKSLLEKHNLVVKIDIPSQDRLPFEVFLPITTHTLPNILENTYFVSNYSRVYSKITKKLLKIRYPADMYPTFSVQDTNGRSHKILLHRALMITFYPEHDINKNVVNHINGDKWASYLSNLEFTDTQGNAIHARDTGLTHPAKGESHCCAKITEKECRKICEMLETQDYSIVDIAKIMNVSESIVGSIKIGKAWKHIRCEYNIPNERRLRYSKYFNNDDLYALCKYFQTHPKTDDMILMEYVRTALKANNLPLGEGQIDGCRKLYRKQKWKYVWCKFNY